MIDFLQTTEGVVTAAAVYLLVGLAWNLVFNACGYLNLALGQFYIFGAVFAYKLQTTGGISSPIINGVLVLAAVGVLAFISERFLLRPLDRQGLDPLIVTIGLSLVLLQVAKELSPATVIRPDSFVSGSISPGGVHIAGQELIVWATALIVTIGFFAFSTRTDTGRSMRACTDNRDAALTLGIHVRTYATVAFVVSGMIAALAAFVVAPTQGSAYNSGDLIAIKAFLAVSIVGLGRNGGAVLGAFVVAGAQGYIARYWNPDVADIVVLVGFLVVVCVHAVRSSAHQVLPAWLRRRPRVRLQSA